MNNKVHYLSPEGLKKLEEELHELKTVRQRETADKIEAAKALGDLSENAEYQEAKQEMSFIHGRRQEIETILKNVEIIKEGGSDIIEIGSSIDTEIKGENKKFKIVGSEEADPFEGLISNESPLGSAFLGHGKGDEIEVETPGGVQVYKILSVS
ncbi:MAG: transcription elongation factor GreA [Patescibacteria group bacterium]|nr:transcription elongation factor GreA [Patescibacteria group bacterium]MBU2508987.1 transcription elongation factor GreA [Patescibacteria group bacterium]